MPEFINPKEIQTIAGLELNLLHSTNAFAGFDLEGLRVENGSPIHDPNGEILFYRLPLTKAGGLRAGYADVAAHPFLGAPLLAVAPNAPWDEKSLINEARHALLRFEELHEHGRSRHYDEIRLVAYSYPKLAVQFLHSNEEVVMLELGSWTRVPRQSNMERPRMEPGNFERWSLIEELPNDLSRERTRNFEERLERLRGSDLQILDPSLITRTRFDSPVIRLTDTLELHYSTRPTDHHACYELRGQETSVWCVVASVQMVLDFYRYEYTQSRISQQLGLGTLSSPSGLPYARDNDVTVALNVMSSSALSSTMLTTPPFSTYCDEIRSNRPLISFIPGHSRTVAGYTESLLWILGGRGFRGLLVYDPWPPNSGVITRWENFDTQTYRRAFTAAVSKI